MTFCFRGHGLRHLTADHEDWLLKGRLECSRDIQLKSSSIIRGTIYTKRHFRQSAIGMTVVSNTARRL